MQHQTRNAERSIRIETGWMTQIPVYIISGFLGSGKTTLLGKALSDNRFENSALIINEVGEIPVDDILLDGKSLEYRVLSGGCICCQMQQDIGYTLRNILLQRPDQPFERILIETTGLADPLPIMRTLMSDGWLSARFRMASVVSVADAINLAATLPRHEEAARQLLIADQIILSKCDLATDEQIDEARGMIRECNGDAPIVLAVDGAVDPGFLLEENHHADGARVASWLGEAISPTHRSHYDSASVKLRAPLHWPDVARALDKIVEDHGDHILRIKGILHLSASDRPVVVHSVQSFFHPPTILERWTEEGPHSRIVFITRSFEAKVLIDMFCDMVASDAPAAPLASLADVGASRLDIR